MAVAPTLVESETVTVSPASTCPKMASVMDWAKAMPARLMVSAVASVETSAASARPVAHARVYACIRAGDGCRSLSECFG